MTSARTAGALLALAANEAQAHLVETGFGAFYNGVAHVFMTPADLLVVVAIALLAGLRGTGASRLAVLALPAAWLAGAAVGARWDAGAGWTLLTTVTFLLAGGLVALDFRLRDSAVAVLAGLAGAIHGAANGASIAAVAGRPLLLAGALTAVFCLATLLAAEVTTLRAGWSRTAVRVGGSWIAAAGVLMLGWLAR